MFNFKTSTKMFPSLVKSSQQAYNICMIDMFLFGNIDFIHMLLSSFVEDMAVIKLFFATLKSSVKINLEDGNHVSWITLQENVPHKHVTGNIAFITDQDGILEPSESAIVGIGDTIVLSRNNAVIVSSSSPNKERIIPFKRFVAMA